MLVVVHHGDVEGLLQTLLDVEALRSLDVFQVDTTKSGGDTLHSLTEFLRVFFVDFDIKHVNTTVNLEEQSLTFHHGFSAQGTDIA